MHFGDAGNELVAKTGQQHQQRESQLVFRATLLPQSTMLAADDSHLPFPLPIVLIQKRPAAKEIVVILKCRTTADTSLKAYAMMLYLMTAS
jgi:hypothetical protein